jgi:hypothetical protein
MRDRLEELRQRAQEFREARNKADETPFPEEDPDSDDPAWVSVATRQQAVVFEKEPVLENFLSEAQHIRGDITELETEVSDLTHSS